MAETAEYPGAITTQLFNMVARKSTTLTSDITSTTTPLPVASTTGFTTEGFAVVENETIYYKGITATNIGTTTCTRGYDGTAVAHVSGLAVKSAIVASNWNRLKVEIVATQTYAGTSGGTQGGINAKYLGGSTVGELAPTYGKNLIINGAFVDSDGDNLPDFWDLFNTPTLAIAADTLFPARGGNQITITCTAGITEGILTKEPDDWLKVLPSTKYTFSIDYKVTEGDYLKVIISSYAGAIPGTTHINDDTLASTDAVRVTYTFTTDADADHLRITLAGKNDEDIVIVSHPKLEQGANATPYIEDNADLVDNIHGSTLAENSIVFSPDAFNLDNDSPAELSETDGTSVAPKRKFVLFAKTEKSDLTQFLMPRTYNAGSVTGQLLLSCETATQGYKFGIRVLVGGSGDAYTGSYGNTQFFDMDTSSATSNDMQLISKEFSQTQTSFAVNKLTNIQICRDDSGDTAEQRIHNFRIRLDKG